MASTKEIYIVTWEFTDGSKHGLVSAFEDKDDALRLIADLIPLQPSCVEVWTEEFTSAQ